jgi:hypothetical protein
MKRLLCAGLALGLLAGCTKNIALERALSSFEITIMSPVGSTGHRCVLPGSSTAGADLSGCPSYAKDPDGVSVVELEFVARALDNEGQLLETYDSLASLSVVPGSIEPGLDKIRFRNGVATGPAGKNPFVAFRGAFGDTFLWLTDSIGPPRATDVPGFGISCSYQSMGRCAPLGLACINTTAQVGFDPNGLAYCSKGCKIDGDCPSGYFCGTKIQTYPDSSADTSNGACVRDQASYAAGVAGPVYLVEPTIADIRRTDSLVTTPYQGDFVALSRGKMVVTAVRIDGFYVTDLCPAGGPPQNAALASAAGDPACPAEDRAALPEFNSVFVYNYSRPEDLYVGDQLNSFSGPIGNFNGYTEVNFPIWDVNLAAGSAQIPTPLSLDDLIIDHFPNLLLQGQKCYNSGVNPTTQTIISCDFALERLQSGRVQVMIQSSLPINPGSTEATSLAKYGQWPVTAGNSMTKTFQMITRDNIPFFDPIKNGGKTINQPVIGNLRKVAFDETSDPIWIVEPRDQADCPWCKN